MEDIYIQIRMLQFYFFVPLSHLNLMGSNSKYGYHRTNLFLQWKKRYTNFGHKGVTHTYLAQTPEIGQGLGRFSKLRSA